MPAQSQDKTELIVDCEVRVVQPSARCLDNPKIKVEPAYETIYTHPRIHEVIKYWSVDSALASMNQLGIQYGLLSGLAWQTEEILHDNNAYVRECLMRYPDRFKGWYTPHLKDPVRAADEIMQLNKEHYVGVEIIPKWQNANADDSRLAPVIEAVSIRDMFMKVYTAHPTQTLNGDAPYRTLQLLRRHPETKFVIPHLGGLLCLYGLLPSIRDVIRNAYFITSVTATMKMVEYAADVNPDNLLFGTDFPFNHCFDQKTPLKEIESLKLNPEVKSKILGKTAAELFHFGA
jgi:predicted TIM-barrel fold metal-dependent hydrolase